MPRVAVTVRLPRSIYCPANLTVAGFAPSTASRFAAVRERTGEGPWLLVHRRTGMQVGSLLPPKKATLRDLLAVIDAWDAATHLDQSWLDTLPECVAGTHEKDIPRPSAELMAKCVPEMRILAANAI